MAGDKGVIKSHKIESIAALGLLSASLFVFQNCSKSSTPNPNLLTGGTPTSSLQLTDNGQTITDAKLNVVWLADANFVTTPTGQAILSAEGVTGVSADGRMDYATAVKWVKALNNYQQPQCPAGKTGYLCHRNWQLPSTPSSDSTCTATSGAGGQSYGPNCHQSAYGSLFYEGLKFSFPSSVASWPGAVSPPIKNLFSGLYWTSDASAGGETTFSFLEGIKFSNTTKYNLMRILPELDGKIPASTLSGNGEVQLYVSGPAAELAAYDTSTQKSWPLDANLASSKSFGVSGNLSLPAGTSNNPVTMPLVAPYGVIHFSAIPTWLSGMNQSGFAGANAWKLPSYSDLATLFTDLGFQAGDSALIYSGSDGLFSKFQPFLYWSCPLAVGASPGGICDYSSNAGINSVGVVMQWAFNFDSGFQGTDENTKKLFVNVYHPVSP